MIWRGHDSDAWRVAHVSDESRDLHRKQVAAAAAASLLLVLGRTPICNSNRSIFIDFVPIRPRAER